MDPEVQPRRTRKKPTWVLTLTEVARNGKSVSTVWLYVNDRNKEIMERVIRVHTLDNQRTIVTTDGWKRYSNVISFCDHFTVNHSSKVCRRVMSFSSRAGYT